MASTVMYRVMLVDDSLFLRQWYKMVLERGGYLIAGEAANGYEALARYPELNPDVVILDINMPGINGLATMGEMLETDPNAKIIISSAMGQEAHVRRAVLAGAKSFLVKPVREAMLLHTLKRVLQESRTDRV